MHNTLSSKHDRMTSETSAKSPPAISVPPSLAGQAATTSQWHQRQVHLGNSSVLELGRELVDETKILIRQELTLVKTEVREKLAFVGRNAAGLGAGLGIAYAGAIVFLIGFAFLIAWAIHLAGIQSLFAAFLGLVGIGLFTVVTGVGLIFKGLSALKAESLAPERTLHTLQQLKGGPTTEKPKTASEPKLPETTSAEMQSHVEATESQIGETLEALRDRLSPRNIKSRITHRVQVHPYRNSFLAMGAGLLSGFAIRKRFSRA